MLINNNYIGKRIPKHKNISTEQYIDELTKIDYDKLKTKKIIGVDVGKSDLWYCVDGTSKKRKQFRYTQNQRRKNTKQKKYRNIIQKLKNEKMNESDNVIELETKLSLFNKKTLKIKKFEKYIKNKNILNEKLFKFYKQFIFRKLKLNSYINRLKNEQQLINNFINKFGKQTDIIICVGDWEQKKQMKYKEPTKGKGMRSLFKKNGFDVYLVDEYKTSCICNKCHGNCEKFRICNNPRPWKKDEITIRHGLLRCKTCKVLWNRDENSSCNIYKIATCAIEGKARPEYLTRSAQ